MKRILTRNMSPEELEAYKKGRKQYLHYTYLYDKIFGIVDWSKYKQAAIERAKRIRLEVLVHYSNSDKPFCVCCNESNMEFLCIDHIDGNGNEHRRHINNSKFTSGGAPFYSWLIKNKYPKGYQVLCFNCNNSKAHYGYCPHKKAQEEIEQASIKLYEATYVKE